MKLSIILTTLLSTFAIEPPDLCADVYTGPTGAPYTDSLDQTLPRYCAWTGPDVPVWDNDVCCSIDDSGASCTVTDSAGHCSRELERAYCKYGEAVAGGFVCYRPFIDACEAGWCIDSPPPPEAELAVAFLACCNDGGACQYVTTENIQDCQGEFVACDWGILHDGGVVECFG
jgi:hypothetical protein